MLIQSFSCCSWTLRWKHLQDRECRLVKADEGECLRWTIVRCTMWNEAGLKLKPCCVFMKIHLRQSFAGTCLSQLVGAEAFEGDTSDFGKCFTPILRLRILRPSHQQKALRARASRRGSLKRWSCTACGMFMLARLVIANRSIYDGSFMLARLVLNAVVFQLDQSDLQTKTGAYSLGKCVERIVLTHSREFVWVLPLGLLCLFFCFFVPPLFCTFAVLLAIFGLRPVVQPRGVWHICLRLWPSATGTRHRWDQGSNVRTWAVGCRCSKPMPSNACSDLSEDGWLVWNMNNG